MNKITFMIAATIFITSNSIGAANKIPIACKLGTNTGAPYSQNYKLNWDFEWDSEQKIWVWYDKSKQITLTKSGKYRAYTKEMGLETGTCDMP